MSAAQVDRTATAFARSVALAVKGGYDAVEIMGSEGYLINQFLAERTNDRSDAWGGSAEKRMRFPLEVVRRTRDLVGDDLPIVYRISLLDLVEGGQSWDEVLTLAHLLTEAGVSVLNTGIGWHEARIPTIITQVPPAAWRSVTARLKAEVSVPVCASNRINTPELAESILADGDADLVSMARPLLADPEFVDQGRRRPGRRDQHLHRLQPGLPRPHLRQQDGLLPGQPARLPRDHAGARPDARTPLGRRGRRRPGRSRDGGLRGRARPGGHPLRGRARAGRAVPPGDGGARQGGLRRDAALLHPAPRGARRRRAALDPRHAPPTWPASTRSWSPPASSRGCRRSPAPTTRGWSPTPTCSRAGSCPVKRVAVIGAGGIGVDVSHWLVHDPASPGPDEQAGVEEWMAHWGVGDPSLHRGGLTERKPREPFREVTLLQRKTTMIGKDLGKTSGWAHRAVLKQSGVTQVAGATYERIEARDDAVVLHVTVDGEPRELVVDHVVLCAGQESVRSLFDDLTAAETHPGLHLVGGADVAAELDAKRAIEQGTRVAAAL